MRQGLTLLALVVLALPAYAQEPTRSAMAVCSVIAGELERLECYDEIARAVGLLTDPAPAAAAGGEWVVREDINPLDDSRTFIAGVESQSGSNRYGDPVVLFVRCLSDELAVYVDWDSYLGSEANVTLRIGDQPATSRRWAMSTDNAATFLPGNQSAIRQFLEGLRAESRLVAQVTPYNESPITAVFNLVGAQDVIDAVFSTCS